MHVECEDGKRVQLPSAMHNNDIIVGIKDDVIIYARYQIGSQF